jgi:hypothetical protein
VLIQGLDQMRNGRRNRGNRTNGHADAVSVLPPRCAIDEAFLDKTIALFQSRTDRTLTREDAREMIENVTGFFRILGEWNRQEARRAADTTGPNKHSEKELRNSDSAGE